MLKFIVNTKIFIPSIWNAEWIEVVLLLLDWLGYHDHGDWHREGTAFIGPLWL